MVDVFRTSLGKLQKLGALRHTFVGAQHASQHHTFIYRHWQHGRVILICPEGGRSNFPISLLCEPVAMAACHS